MKEILSIILQMVAGGFILAGLLNLVKALRMLRKMEKEKKDK